MSTVDMNQWMREQWRQGGMVDPTEVRRRLAERDDTGNGKPSFSDLLRTAAGYGAEQARDDAEPAAEQGQERQAEARRLAEETDLSPAEIDAILDLRGLAPAPPRRPLPNDGRGGAVQDRPSMADLIRDGFGH